MLRLLWRLRSRFTYANIMSTIAVFLVLGTGVAVGHHAPNNTGTKALKDGAVTTPKIKEGAVTRPKLASSVRPRWANVSSTGELTAGRGAIGVRSGGGSPDQWVVEFDRFNFQNCSAVASVVGGSGGAIAMVAGAGENEVLVNIVNADGSLASGSFRVQVMC